MGAYDYNGNIVVPFNYQSVKALNATHYVVQQHNQYYLFDSQSQSVISQPYDSIVFNKELVIAEKTKNNLSLIITVNQSNYLIIRIKP